MEPETAPANGGVDLTAEPPAAPESETTIEDPTESVARAAAELAPVTPGHVTAPSAAGPPATGAPSRVLGYLLAGAAGIALTLAVLVGTGTVAVGGTATPSPTPEPTFAMADATVGVATAPVTIEVWADYQCPYCGAFTHGVEPSLLREYAATGTALVRFRDFAFLGQESIDAAVAAHCADRQGRFWRYHDLLFASQQGENQGGFSKNRLEQLAGFAGLDPTAFSTCLDDPAVVKEVAAETEEGRSFGVVSTPTLRIVGPGGARILQGISAPDAIAGAIAQAAAPIPPGSPGASPSLHPTANPAQSPAGSPGPSGPTAP